MNVIEFEVPSNYESVASRLEDALSEMECPIRKEKALIAHLGKVNRYKFGLFVTDSESKYPNVSEVMDLYFSSNISKQEERKKRDNTKDSLGRILSEYHSDMKENIRIELQKILNKA